MSIALRMLSPVMPLAHAVFTDVVKASSAVIQVDEHLPPMKSDGRQSSMDDL